MAEAAKERRAPAVDQRRDEEAADDDERNARHRHPDPGLVLNEAIGARNTGYGREPIPAPPDRESRRQAQQEHQPNGAIAKRGAKSRFRPP